MADQMINLLSRAAFEQFLDKVIEGDLLPDQVDAAEKASPYLGVYLLPGQVDLARAADRALTKLETTESITRTWGREEEALAALRQAIGDRVRSRVIKMNSTPSPPRKATPEASLIEKGIDRGEAGYESGINALR